MGIGDEQWQATGGKALRCCIDPFSLRRRRTNLEWQETEVFWITKHLMSIGLFTPKRSRKCNHPKWRHIHALVAYAAGTLSLT